MINIDPHHYRVIKISSPYHHPHLALPLYFLKIIIYTLKSNPSFHILQYGKIELGVRSMLFENGS